MCSRIEQRPQVEYTPFTIAREILHALCTPNYNYFVMYMLISENDYSIKSVSRMAQKITSTTSQEW